jgi:hypothetical protein
MADDEVAKIGVILENLNSRFDLVIEAVSAFGSQLQSLRDEIGWQFAEVGKQVRFLSEQIGENRERINVLRSEFTAEMVRLGEALGATRVEVRENFARTRSSLGNEIAARSDEVLATLRSELSSVVAQERAVAATARRASGKRQPLDAAASANGSLAKLIDAELKQTNKTLTALNKKFDRFDDRVSVEVKDHDQRLRKLERPGRR